MRSSVKGERGGFAGPERGAGGKRGLWQRRVAKDMRGIIGLVILSGDVYPKTYSTSRGRRVTQVLRSPQDDKRHSSVTWPPLLVEVPDLISDNPIIVSGTRRVHAEPMEKLFVHDMEDIIC